MVLVPLNVVTQQALEELIPELKALLGGNGEAIFEMRLGSYWLKTFPLWFLG